MGVAVSGWRLASTVAREGGLGVVSGTALDVVVARRLQMGDEDVRRACLMFPDQAAGQRVVDSYFIEGGKAADKAFKSTPMFKAAPTRRAVDLAVLGGFAEVWLAREGHDGKVGINFLEKVQLPTPATLYGAMVAGVDAVLVGAGIPRDIPVMMDALAEGRSVDVPLHITELPDTDPNAAPREREMEHFDPSESFEMASYLLPRPQFLAIIASATLGLSLTKRGGGGVDGFVIEGPTAGGHNAPPRGQMILENGEPVYGPRDVVDLEKIRSIGLPFWLAGGWGTPERLQAARAEGARGVQVGTAFAFSDESGVDPILRRKVLRQVKAGEIEVKTDPLASPTGFPFKVAMVPGTVAQKEVFEARVPRCDLGYLRETYRQEDGGLGYRCPSEPVKDFIQKGGEEAEIEGRKCVCNALFATIGLGQFRGDLGTEAPLVTAGDDLKDLARFLVDRDHYSAVDVVRYLNGESVFEGSQDFRRHADAETLADGLIAT